MTLKFGIVSSFDVLCGNATYAEAIAKGLEKDFEVIKIDVPTSLQKGADTASLKKIVSKVKECDHINIQMELGLYGPTPSLAWGVLKRIMQESKSFSVTMHRLDKSPSNLVRKCYTALKSGQIKAMFKILFIHLAEYEIARRYAQIVNFTNSQKGSLIVHTQREKLRALKINPNVKVFIYPIVWPTEVHPTVNLTDKFTNLFPIVGLFGFISDYKNYEVVADGLLNKKYNIFLAGGVHPQAPFYGKKSTKRFPSYIRKISQIFSKKKYVGRVYIETSPTDSQLIQYIQSVDVVCIPYAETGQSGSGVASLAVQYGKRIIFSDTHCTNELVRFLNKRPFIFDVDSPLGLSCAVDAVLQSNDRIFFSGYNFDGLLETYKLAS